MRYSYLILVSVCCCLCLKALGQQVFDIKGVIFKKPGTERASQIVIKNLKSNNVTVSNDLGGFTIKASIGDTLLFSKTNFAEQKVKITGTGDIVVYMQATINLSEVTIHGQNKRQELSEVMSDYRKQGTFYDGKP